MSIEIELGEKAKLSIAEFVTERGAFYISIRRLYKTKDQKYFPQKTKSGGYNSIYLSKEEWTAVLPRLKAYVEAVKPPPPSPSKSNSKKSDSLPTKKKPVDDSF